MTNDVDAFEPYGFIPHAGRAAWLDQRVRAALAESLGAVFDSLDLSTTRSPQRDLLEQIIAMPVRPVVFGTYVELVLAVFGDRLDEAAALATELASTPPAAPPTLQVLRLDDDDLGPGQAARYQRLVTDDVLAEIGPVAAKSWERADATLKAGFDLLRAAAPEVCAEVLAFIREIVLVTGHSDLDGVGVGGASSFALWGSQILMADHLDIRLNTALVLAHEAAHTHLFGLAQGGRLVENPDEERYPSPYRDDPRPMEGIAHATYVFARLVYVSRALLMSGRLTRPEAVEVAHQIDRNSQGFDEGLATLMAHAGLTDAGRETFDAARRYMDDFNRSSAAAHHENP